MDASPSVSQLRPPLSIRRSLTIRGPALAGHTKACPALGSCRLLHLFSPNAARVRILTSPPGANATLLARQTLTGISHASSHCRSGRTTALRDEPEALQRRVDEPARPAAQPAPRLEQHLARPGTA